MEQNDLLQSLKSLESKVNNVEQESKAHITKLEDEVKAMSDVVTKLENARKNGRRAKALSSELSEASKVIDNAVEDEPQNEHKKLSSAGKVDDKLVAEAVEGVHENEQKKLSSAGKLDDKVVATVVEAKHEHEQKKLSSEGKVDDNVVNDHQSPRETQYSYIARGSDALPERRHLRSLAVSIQARVQNLSFLMAERVRIAVHLLLASCSCTYKSACCSTRNLTARPCTLCLCCYAAVHHPAAALSPTVRVKCGKCHYDWLNFMQLETEATERVYEYPKRPEHPKRRPTPTAEWLSKRLGRTFAPAAASGGGSQKASSQKASSGDAPGSTKMLSVWLSNLLTVL